MKPASTDSPTCAVCEHDLADHFHIDPERRVGECTRSCGCECYQSRFVKEMLQADDADIRRVVAEILAQTAL